MITEDYVSFEAAKLLKEKGFNGECVAYYSIYKDNNASLHRWRNRQTYVNVKNDGYTIAPTLQMAMKWLRMEKDIQIEITIVGVEWESPTKWYYGFRCQNKEYIDRRDANLASYEEACEAAIKYCLENLI